MLSINIINRVYENFWGQIFFIVQENNVKF
jgi:hypothetical protein